MALTWGCPWHGLINNDVLIAPNGRELSWPGFGIVPYHRGTTHLIQVPGVPEPVRSEAEQTDDTARGYQWRNWAMLTGAAPHLHGQWLGAWVYSAPDGSRWAVLLDGLEQVPLGGAAWAGTVTVRRFGLFDGTHDERDFAYSLDPQQPAVAWVTVPLTPELHAVTPDGSQAILMAVSTNRPVHEQATPLGFYRVELSGGVDDLALSVSVLYGQAAAMGASSGSFPVETTSPEGDLISAGPWSAQHTGRVVAAWFAAGDVVPVTVDMHWSGLLDNPAPTGTPSSRTCTSSSSLAWTLKVGGVTIDTLNASATQTIYAQRDDEETEGDQSVLDETNVITVLGDERTYALSGPLGGSTLPAAGPQLLNYWTTNPISNTFPGVGPIITDDPGRFVLAYVHRYSNTLLGWAIRWLDRDASTMTVTYRAACHPGGVDSGELVVAGDPNNTGIGYLPYGSYDPVAGAVTRNSADSVCYV